MDETDPIADAAGASSDGPAVLVTGATGFVGGRLVAALAAQGQRVRALTRRSTGLEALERPGIEVVRGDLLDSPSLVRAAEGASLVFHAAARVSDWGPREAFFAANVDGTRNLVAACREAGVARLVHLGSLTVLGLPRDGRVLDERTLPEPPARGDFYTESKLEGEKIAREAHGTGGLETTVVRPGAIWGPGDPNVVPRIVRLLRRGAMPYVGGGRNLVGLVHVENLVRGLLLAGSVPAAAGEVFHLTDGEEITAREAIDGIADALGVPRPRVSLPFPLVLAAAALVEGTARALRLRRPPPLTRYGARFVACHARYDLAKARRELGWEPAVSFREGVEELFR
ncbi:MAG TPA: NAD-dependent epimerase/dehydratase family protein [Thermoanaerobaculia bacterium]|nr:NAD-dependent epimerase/dehydratase family protein [Thermoanaerobaculia bacterium]